MKHLNALICHFLICGTEYVYVYVYVFPIVSVKSLNCQGNVGKFLWLNSFSRHRAETRPRKSPFCSALEVRRGVRGRGWGRGQGWGRGLRSGPGALQIQAAPLTSTPPSGRTSFTISAALRRLRLCSRQTVKEASKPGHTAAWCAWRLVRRSQLVQNSCARRR